MFGAKAEALGPHSEEPPVSLRTRGLFILVGASGWFASNVMFAALPLFVEVLHSGAAVASLAQSTTQIGAIFTIVFVRLWGSNDDDIDDSNGSVLTARVQLWKKERASRLLQESTMITHVGQSVACLGLAVFALLWAGWQTEQQVVWLSAVTGAVGNMADVYLWHLVVQHESPRACAELMQIGASFSGVFTNLMFAGTQSFGITSFFIIAALIEVILWLAVCEVAGRPNFGEKRKQHCMCAGCAGCQLQQQSRRDGTLALLNEPLLRGHALCSDQIHALAAGVESCCKPREVEEEGSTEVSDLSPREEEQTPASFYKTSCFILKAVMYSVPALLPFIAAPYGWAKLALYTSMQTMYNLGNICGRALFLVYRPSRFVLWCSTVVMVATFTYMLCGFVFPTEVAQMLPSQIAFWVVPGIVGVFNFSTGMLWTGMFSEVSEAVSQKKYSQSLPASMGYYGLIGCVSGNLVVWLALHANMWR